MNGEKRNGKFRMPNGMGETGNLTEPHKICVKYFFTTNEHRLICQHVIWVRLDGKTHFIHFLEARWMQMDDVILAESLRHSARRELHRLQRVEYQIKMKFNR